MAAVMIGVDPHKGSHTRWRSGRRRRCWARSGCGPAPPKLAARVRLLASGNVNKNDPNDARPVAVAALRPGACLPARPDDHASVLKIWAKRHRDLSRARNQVVCRMHAVLCDLVPGGVSKSITAGQAARILEQVQPRGAAGAARWILAEQFLTDLRRIDVQRRDVQKKLAAAVRASALPPAWRAREGTRGTALSPAWPARTPNTGSSARPLPDLIPAYDRSPARPRARAPARQTRWPAPAHTSASHKLFPHVPADVRVPRRQGRPLACPLLLQPRPQRPESSTHLLTARTKRNLY
jgi:hypothetical protein